MRLRVPRLGVAAALLCLIAAAVRVDALVSLVVVDVLVWAMIAYETFFVYDERRYQLWHDIGPGQAAADRRSTDLIPGP